eukprot:2539561-Amphidinium_carterae.1
MDPTQSPIHLSFFPACPYTSSDHPSSPYDGVDLHRCRDHDDIIAVMLFIVVVSVKLLVPLVIYAFSNDCSRRRIFIWCIAHCRAMKARHRHFTSRQQAHTDAGRH